MTDSDHVLGHCNYFVIHLHYTCNVLCLCGRKITKFHYIFISLYKRTSITKLHVRPSVPHIHIFCAASKLNCYLIEFKITLDNCEPIQDGVPHVRTTPLSQRSSRTCNVNILYAIICIRAVIILCSERLKKR